MQCHNLPGHVHPLECCKEVDEDFQCMARAIPVAIDVAPWYTRGRGIGGSGEMTKTDIEKCIQGIVQRFLLKESTVAKLKREMVFQTDLGSCERITRRSSSGSSIADGSNISSTDGSDLMNTTTTTNEKEEKEARGTRIHGGSELHSQKYIPENKRKQKSIVEMTALDSVDQL